jgi:hypothetical protein
MSQGIKSGLTPSRMRGGKPYNGSMNEYPIANAYGVNLFKGDVVKLSGGVVVRAESSIGADPLLGVFMGCQYISDQTGQLVNSSYFPSGTSSKGGTLINGWAQPLALVVDDPEVTYIVNSKTSVTLGQVGSRYRLSIVAGNVNTGQSGAILDSALTVDSSSGAAVRIVGLYNIPNQPVNAAGGSLVVEVALTSTGMIGLQ